MKRPSLVAAAALATASLLTTLAACGPGGGETTTSRKKSGGKSVKVKSFSETLGITTLVGTDSNLWVGTPRGLVKWDIRAKTFQLLTKTEGLPADKIAALAPDSSGGVWVMTKEGVAHEQKGVWSNSPSVPVGDFVTGFVEAPDGSLWAGGPDGLARLGKGPGARWERYLPGVSVTSLVASGNEMWVGTSGKGIIRIVGDEAQTFGMEQGNDTDVVRGMAIGPLGVIAVGEGPGGGRVAAWDGKRFWSYKVEGPKGLVVEWVRRIGNDVLFGAGTNIYALTRAPSGGGSGPIRLTVVERKSARLGALITPARDEKADAAAAAAAAPEPAKDPKGKKPKTTDKAKPAPAPTPAPVAAAPAAPAKPTGPRNAAYVEDSKAEAPRWDTARWGPALPEQVTAVGSDGLSLYVGTRFLGAVRIDKELTHFRTADLAQNAVRLTVACEGSTACYVATGGPHAWKFDGQTFDVAVVDPEVGSRVLAVVNNPAGGVLAFHRGAKDPTLRMSTVAENRWTPIGVTEVTLPEGNPELTFAVFAPSRRLWLGLHYIDKVGDRVDYGAAEVDLEKGHVVYHRRFATMPSKKKKPESQGLLLPNDLESAYFRSDEDFWFGTNAGAVHVKGKEVRVFTENDGLESEFIHDVLEGNDDKVWVATSRGIGKFDGTRWRFPAEGDNLKIKATSLVRDRRDFVYIGTDKGLVMKGIGTVIDRLDAAGGLLDDKILNLAIDRNERVWVLTEKGISILDR